MVSDIWRFWELWDVVAEREKMSRMRGYPKGVEVRRSVEISERSHGVWL